MESHCKQERDCIRLHNLLKLYDIRIDIIIIFTDPRLRCLLCGGFGHHKKAHAAVKNGNKIFYN